MLRRTFHLWKEPKWPFPTRIFLPTKMKPKPKFTTKRRVSSQVIENVGKRFVPIFFRPKFNWFERSPHLLGSRANRVEVEQALCRGERNFRVPNPRLRKLFRKCCFWRNSIQPLKLAFYGTPLHRQEMKGFASDFRLSLSCSSSAAGWTSPCTRSCPTWSWPYLTFSF